MWRGDPQGNQAAYKRAPRSLATEVLAIWLNLPTKNFTALSINAP